LSDQQTEVRNDVVLPSSLMVKIQNLARKANPPQTVSEYIEKVLRATVSAEESKTVELSDEDSESIKARLRELGYL